MYEYHNNLLSIPARLLYEDWSLMSYDNYKMSCRRGRLIRTKEGRGEGNEAFVSFYDLPISIKKFCIEKLGDPKEVVVRNQLENYIIADHQAVQFFARHRKPDGVPLSEELQREKATNAMILNGIKTVFKDNRTIIKMFGKNRTKIWENISDAVNAINTSKWTFSLPGNPRRLKSKYDEYVKEGFEVLLHKGEGRKNAQKIKGAIADFFLAQYCLPMKLTIPEVMERYNERREVTEWEEITETAVYKWLYEPEQERIWMLARHGKNSWSKKFKHTLTRNTEDWFPNAYWAIDGSKLDWIHVWDDSSNKMGAKLKIDVMFDVYSEKIIGYSLSFTENHIDHFKAVKMAVNEAQCRPYYLTYDNQSAHKSKRIQELYDSLVAIDGGAHHPNKALETHGPAEQLFNRFQQQVIKKFWFSDGQGIQVRRDDNKMNVEFINENKGLLKTTHELQQAWETAVNIWNNKKHPKFKESRNQVYQHEMKLKEDLSLLEIVDKMWIQETSKQITYRAHGLEMWLADEKYQYEVYDTEGNIDIEFRRKNIGNKFTIRYDPDFMDGYIQLCKTDEQGNTVFLANAEPKRQHQNIPVLQQEGDKEQWHKDYKIRDIEFDRDKKAYEDLKRRTGITPELEIENQELLMKMKGSISKNQRSNAESNENLIYQL